MPETVYTVSIYSSRLPLPLSLAVHTYLVVSDGITTQRYEVIRPGSFSQHEPVFGRIFKDILPPDHGFSVFAYLKRYRLRWPARCHGTVCGSIGSPAHQLYTLITSDQLFAYPFVNKYHMLGGPNSNTFIQWVVDQVPECGLKLPWNAWGKGYKE